MPLTPGSFLKFAVRTYPERIAWTYENRQTNYREFEHRCCKLASVLRSMGVGREDVVTVIAPNGPAMLELHYAVPMLGAVLNTVNIRQDDAHYKYVFDQAKPAVVFADIEYLVRTQIAINNSNINCSVVVIDDASAGQAPFTGTQEYEKLLRDCTTVAVFEAIQSELDPIVLNYTSGTSGKPKGVLHSHRSAYLNAVGVSMLWNLPILPVYLWVVPMFHSNGWSLTWAVTLRAGTHVLMRKVIPAQIFDTLDHKGITHICCAPTVLDMLLSENRGKTRIGSPVVEIGTGGSPPNGTRIKRMRELGFNITHLYGMTETLSNSVYCALQPDWAQLGPSDYAAEVRRQGIAQPMVEDVEIFDIVTNKIQPKDGHSVGEVRIRSNTVMMKYLDDPKATAEAMQDGWFRTGDLGIFHPDGYLELTDRLKDVIISGGENISSLEIEDFLAGHDSIEEVSVVAMPDDKWGEVPCAIVKLVADCKPVSEESIIEWCRDGVSGFKRPKRVMFVADFPRTTTGKIRKAELRTQIQNNEI